MGCRRQCLLFPLTLVITRGLLLWRCFFNLKFKLTKTPSLHHLLVKMPPLTRNSKNHSSSSSTTTLKPPQDCPNIHNDFLSPLKQNSAEKRSLVCGISRSGSGSRSAKCPVFRNNVVGVHEVSTPRRSLRLSLLQDPNTNQLVNNKTSNCKSDDEGVWSSNKGKGEVETSDRRGVVIGLKASNARESAVGIYETKKLEIATVDNKRKRRRKRAEEATNRDVEGWTKDQEMALQRAFFTAKPTPNFWKKVSKLVNLFSFILLFSASLIFFSPFPDCA
ncbi:hypothetical protein OIU77_005500 [Salix suchowensis]|uniref:Uncharacterized protein n=1 Tax=Salix suchowensis TaxID=1278906 RepID=A0ABQ9AS74_9ROSI|nr:hypothetical protein OIU77_005500 [Salix suchowensis]